MFKALYITQPALSHHMKILCDSGIITRRKEEKWMFYSISDEGLQAVRECLNQFSVHSDTKIVLGKSFLMRKLSKKI